MKSFFAPLSAAGRVDLDEVAVLWWRLALAVWAGWLTVGLSCLAAG